MPIIPDENTLGRRPVPTAIRQISTDKSGIILGSALTESAAKVGVAIERKQARVDTFAAAKANSELTNAGIRIRRDLVENDPDYENWDKNFQEQIGKEIDRIGGGIRNTNDANLFQLNGNDLVTRGSATIGALAFVKETQVEVANLDALTAENRTALMSAQTPADRQQIMDNQRALNQSALNDRFIDDGNKTKRDQAFVEDWAESFIKMQDPELRVKILKNKKHEMTQFLDNDRRKKLLGDAEKEGKVTRVRRVSQSESDRIMALYPDDRTVGLEEVRKNKSLDPDERAATVALVNQRHSEVGIGLAEDASLLKKNVGAEINKGVHPDDIPADDWAALPPETQRKFEIRSAQVRDRIEPATDPEKWYEWKSMTNAQKASVDLLSDYRMFFGDTEWTNAVNEQSSINSAAKSSSAAIKLEQAGNIQKKIDQQFVNSGLVKEKPTSSDSATKKARWSRLEALVGSEIEAASEAAGGKLKPQEITKIIEEFSVRHVFIDDSIWWSDDVARHLSEVTIDDDIIIPPKDMQELKNLASSAGITNIVSAKTYRRAFLAAERAGVENGTAAARAVLRGEL